TDVNRMGEGETARALLEGMFLPEQRTLQSVLSKGVYKRLKTLCGELSLPIETMSNVKPGMIMNILTILKIQQSGFIQQGVDTYFLDRAREDGRTLRFLEPLEFQIDLLVNMGAGYEDEYVSYALEDFKSSARDLSAIVDEWRRGNGGMVESGLESMAARFPSVYEAMILRRNDAWLPQIEGFLEDSPVELVIAGLAHFYGPDGLLARLERLGYRVEQLD
ncbi:MAG: TraB/GumN family protein, partial [Spirochaetaceae bacterium]|nr:TraB/GumN family protein [Spirochaetaceae bacterium]